MAALDLTGCTFLSTATTKAAALTDLDTFLATAPLVFTSDERLRAASFADETVRKGFWSAVGGELAVRAVAPAPRRGGESWTAVLALDIPADLAGRVAAIRSGAGYSA